jgi:glutaredoxin
MPNALKIVLKLLLIPAFFAAGVLGGPYLSRTYHAWFPPPQFTTGDHAELYRRAGNDVVMYATSTCPYCAKARKLFAARGIRYTEYLIDKSEAAQRDFVSKGGVAVPLLYIGDRRIQGFREPVIVESLAKVRPSAAKPGGTGG